jgi:hypothetical protein
MSALDGGEQSASCPSRFTLREQAVTHWIVGWVALRMSGHCGVEKKNLFPYCKWNPCHPIHYYTALSRIVLAKIKFVCCVTTKSID